MAAGKVDGDRMSSPTFYRFRSEWHMDASRASVFEALRKGENYDRWWPQIRKSARLNDGRYELVARSFLPYELSMILSESVIDEAAGILEANLEGDLEGFSRWTILEMEGQTVAVFEEEVVTHKALLNTFSPVVKPLLRHNHTVMMRKGEQGLRRYLSARQGDPPARRTGSG